MSAPNLPPDVVRILSFHGPVEIGIGTGEGRMSGKVAVCPFDDLIYLLLPAGGGLESALLQSTHVDLLARHADGSYVLRVEGVGSLGRLVSSHAHRGALEPWLPEGVKPTRVMAANLLPLHVDLNRAEGENRARYQGPTAAGKARPTALAAWARLCFSGLAGVMALPGVALPWLYLAVMGAEYPQRPAALVLAVITSLALLAATRMGTAVYALHQWRAGRVREDDVPALLDGWVSLASARLAALIAGGLGLVGLGLLGAIWEPMLALVALSSNGTPLLGPAWLIHLSSSKPESRD
jgi:hypothetical protein